MPVYHCGLGDLESTVKHAEQRGETVRAVVEHDHGMTVVTSPAPPLGSPPVEHRLSSKEAQEAKARFLQPHAAR